MIGNKTMTWYTSSPSCVPLSRGEGVDSYSLSVAFRTNCLNYLLSFSPLTVSFYSCIPGISFHAVLPSQCLPLLLLPSSRYASALFVRRSSTILSTRLAHFRRFSTYHSPFAILSPLSISDTCKTSYNELRNT